MAKVFHGGVPYAIDVKRLMEAFPVPTLTEGRVISHEHFAAVIDVPKGSQRYYSVINSWRSQIKHTAGIIIEWEQTKGVVVLDPAGILNHSEAKTRQKMRQAARAMKLHSYSDRNRLDAVGQQRHDHIGRIYAIFSKQIDNTHHEMAIALAPIKSLPKPKLIREA